MTCGPAEVFISVDVETSGPIPGPFSLLSIGACEIYRPEQAFSCLLQPISRNADPEALAVTGLSMEVLETDGVAPAQAMTQFAVWIESVRDVRTPIFVGFNAAFDWAFINHYFHMFYGRNPFGFAPLDIKSLYMGATGCEWAATKSSKMASVLGATSRGTHDALADAKHQAELFRLICRYPKPGDRSP